MTKIQRLDQHLINVGEAFGKQSPQYAYALSELHKAMNGESNELRVRRVDGLIP